MNLDAILEGFVEHVRNQQFISDTKAKVFRFDSAAVFNDAENASREAPGFAYVIGYDTARNRYPGQVPPPMVQHRLFASCLHSGLAVCELRPLQAAQLLTSLNGSTFLADGQQIQVWLPEDTLNLTATVPCMEYTVSFDLVES